MEQQQKKHKTVPLTFRIDEESLRHLTQESRKKKITISALLNQIIKAHTSWHSFAPEVGFIAARKSLIKTLFEKYDKEEISKIAKDVAAETSDSLILLQTDLSLDTLLNILDTWLEISDFNYRKLELDKKHIRYVIQHEMGEKWSYYLAESLAYSAREMGLNLNATKIADNVLVFELQTH